MIIYTNENNTATLKLLIAANLGGKRVELKPTSLTDKVFSGPRCLPYLVVDDNLSFFSSNAATQYLFPTLDLTLDRQCEQLQEWEATYLQPAIASVLTSKAVPADLKQLLCSGLQAVETRLQKKYLLGDKLSAADVTIWSSLYPLYYKESLRKEFLSQHGAVLRWFEDIASENAVQEALKQWAGSADKPYAPTSSLGIPQLPTLVSPVGSPDETAVEGPTAEELAAAEDSWLHGADRLPPPLPERKIVLPIKGRKNVLITSALPYVNNVPHLGNIIGCVLSADIFARYCRLCDYNTLYVCGTDEYGTATETKALEEGVTPKEICDKYFEIHNAVYRWFNIGFDYFGRTSTQEQKEIVQSMFLKLYNNGFVSNQTVEQLLCEKCDRFLADRFVEGTCPHPGCGYESARGDQCDKCGRLVTATDLVHPRCKLCATKPVIRPSEQLFIELGQIEPSLRTWISQKEAGWSAPARAVTRQWLKEPLRARAVTRDLKWGVPVPLEKYSNKVFYVWFDAPIGYMSITQAATRQYEKWFKPDKECDVKLYQFMAKDNVPFHVIMFPATLLGVNEGHLMADHVFATEYLNYEEGKFSKSRGVGVFGTDARDTGIPADVWRFYLASARPETSDSSFSWAELATRNNSELLNNVGNFCHRALSFCASAFKGRVPAAALTKEDFEVMATVNREYAAYVHNMERGRLRESLKHVMAISRVGNLVMQERQPWVMLKGSEEDKVRGATTISLCCQLVSLLCLLLSPYMPDLSRRLRTQLNVDAVRLRIDPSNPRLIQYLPAGHSIGKPEPLCAKIEPQQVEELKAKYAGSQLERERKSAEKNQGDAKTGVATNCTDSIASLEKAIAEQGEKVRRLKASTKDKAAWQPEVNILLDLKKKLAELQKTPPAATSNPVSNSTDSIASLEKAVAEQGDKVRKLKASTKDKAVWQPEVNILLDLKKRLADLQKSSTTNAAPVSNSNISSSDDSVASLEKAIAEQGDKVRKLKASTKDKTVWQPEVNVLLDLKKRLAALQVQ